MLSRIVVALSVVALAGALGGCAAAPAPEPAPTTPPAQGQDPGVGQGQDPAAGLRLAVGLYELEDGTVQALGTLGYSELEGGFWQVTGGTEAQGDAGKVLVVIANGGDFRSELEALEGKMVRVTGNKLDGVSIRMAGPEMEMTSVEEVSDTPGIAE